MPVQKVECTTAKLNLCINQGSTFELLLNWLDDSDAAIDMTGYTARMHIREELEDEDTLIELTTENGRIALNNPVGAIELSIDAEDTEELDFDAAVYDLELINSTDEVIRLVEGRVTLQREVTR